MNDDPTSSTAAAPVHDEDHPAQLQAPRLGDVKKQNRETFNRMRVYLLEDLIKNLDMLVFAQLSVLYYLDCHIIRFLIRALVQFMFLSPKPALFPSPPKPEPYVGAILGSNILCLVLHIFSKAPAAGEATRFYLHGSVIIDLIGQRGPTSKLLLVLLDAVVVILQLVHLSAHVSRLKVKEQLSGSRPAATQTLDSEERGVRRSAELVQQQVQEAVELQTLNNDGREAMPGGAIRSNDGHEMNSLRADSILSDAFTNGQVVVADLDPVRTVKEQIIRFQQTPPETRRSTLRAHLAGRMVGLRSLAGGTINNR